MIVDTGHAIGWKARDFALQGIDGKTYSLADVCGPKGTLVVFICNHCPYVKASIGRIVTEAKALRQIRAHSTSTAMSAAAGVAGQRGREQVNCGRESRNELQVR